MIDYRQRILNYLEHIAMFKIHESITFASWEAPMRSSTTCQMFWQRGLHDLNEIIRLDMHNKQIDIVIRCAILSKSYFQLWSQNILIYQSDGIHRTQILHNTHA